jgi:hypothetical protein
MRYSEILVQEAYSAGGYSAELWRRWWGNDVTGVLIPVALHEDHDAYLFDHLGDFFTPQELADLPDPDDFATYDDADPDDEIQNNRDAILITAYEHGWNAIIYDGNNQHLALRTSRRDPSLRGLRKLVAKIGREVAVSKLTLYVNELNYDLDDTAIAAFIKYGRLPIGQS